MAGVKRQLVDMVRLVIHPGVVRLRRILRQLHIILLWSHMSEQREAARTAE